LRHFKINIFNLCEKLSEHLIKSYEKGSITEDFALEIANIRNATNIPRSHRLKVSTSNLFFLNFENDKASKVSFIALR
jgi:hypothetical protein